jgi:transcriptional regulator with XRE-family HTH domain
MSDPHTGSRIGYAPGAGMSKDDEHTGRCPDRGARITGLKERLPGYTWKRVAQEVGVSQRAVENWYAGGPISWENLARLAEVLKTTPDFIMTGLEGEKLSPVAVLRQRVDRLEGRVASQDGERAYALRAHDEHVRRELDAIRRELAAQAAATEELLLLARALRREAPGQRPGVEDETQLGSPRASESRPEGS